MPDIAIIGSGPTAIYTLAHLIEGPEPLGITIFESQSEAGRGTPYSPSLNSKAMLSNIASIEIPELAQTLVGWLLALPDEELARLGVARDRIHDREFFPRLVLGEFFQAQFMALLARAAARGHAVDVRTGNHVADIELTPEDIRLTVEEPDGGENLYAFRHVVMATGHSWPEQTEVKPGYFTSPWPASALHTIRNCKVGIRGTSLSAIDALVTVAATHGSFLLDAAGVLQYFPRSETDAFHVTLMSRKGLLPEADFYHPVPYEPLQICTEEAVGQLTASMSTGLLDAVYDLFSRELVACDPSYAAKINLAAQTVETFGTAYFAEREDKDPFVWAAFNLAEAKSNQAKGYTVAWRYAILRMHEVVGRIAPALDAGDLERFHKHFKHVFVDDYATVPHTSIERMLAMHRAGKLDILKLGGDYELDADGPPRGAVLSRDGSDLHFPAFIEATGEKSLKAADLPFPTLQRQGAVRSATADDALLVLGGGPERQVETGGIALDGSYRPASTHGLCNNLYCVSLPFLLHQFPFVQGITSSYDLGKAVGAAILSDMASPLPTP